jgi:hypothetical protein
MAPEWGLRVWCSAARRSLFGSDGAPAVGLVSRVRSRQSAELLDRLAERIDDVHVGPAGLLVIAHRLMAINLITRRQLEIHVLRGTRLQPHGLGPDDWLRAQLLPADLQLGSPRLRHALECWTALNRYGGYAARPPAKGPTKYSPPRSSTSYARSAPNRELVRPFRAPRKESGHGRRLLGPVAISMTRSESLTIGLTLAGEPSRAVGRARPNRRPVKRGYSRPTQRYSSPRRGS